MQRIKPQETHDLHDLHDSQNSHSALSNIAALESDIHSVFTSLEPIVSSSQWKFHKQLSGALQEYIEAISFKHYLANKCIITFDQVQTNLPNIMVTQADYLLGILDLTGELLRYAVTNLSADNSTDSSFSTSQSRQPSEFSLDICQTLRDFKTELTAMDIARTSRVNGYHELHKKVETFNSSLSKLEYSLYSFLVRRCR